MIPEQKYGPFAHGFVTENKSTKGLRILTSDGVKSFILIGVDGRSESVRPTVEDEYLLLVVQVLSSQHEHAAECLRKKVAAFIGGRLISCKVAAFIGGRLISCKVAASIGGHLISCKVK